MQRAGGCPARGLAWERYIASRDRRMLQTIGQQTGQRKVQLCFGAGQSTYAAKHGTICDITGCESFLLPPSSACCACNINSPCR